jgi:2-polyprenyl-3-methyl-5-hydroxy-6-metoxy-1,4-benzoquinol methylase
MQAIEREVSDLYGSLWMELDSVQHPKIVEQFLYNVDLPASWFESKVALDAGCGSGFAVWAMSQLGAKCSAIDLDQTNLDLACQRTELTDAEFKQASVLNSPMLMVRLISSTAMESCTIPLTPFGASLS